MVIYGESTALEWVRERETWVKVFLMRLYTEVSSAQRERRRRSRSHTNESYIASERASAQDVPDTCRMAISRFPRVTCTNRIISRVNKLSINHLVLVVVTHHHHHCTLKILHSSAARKSGCVLLTSRF